MRDSAYISGQPLTQEKVIKIVSARSKTRSRRSAVAIALVFHAFLVAAFCLIFLTGPPPARQEIVIQAPLAEQETEVKKQKIPSQALSREPSPPSSSPTRVITAQSISPLPVDPLDLQLESMDMGTGWGTGWGDGSDGGGTGKGTTFFGTPGGGKAVILVIDVSTSMPGNCGERGLATIKKEIRRTVSSFPQNTRFNIICFGNNADGFLKRPLPASSERKANAHRFMKDYFGGRFTRTRTGDFGRRGTDRGISYVPIEPGDFDSMRNTSGGSRYDLALVAAFHQRAETIFLITDGQPSTRKGGRSLSRSEIVSLVKNEAKEAYRGRLPKINCISINGVGVDYLKEIAREFRGEYKDISPRKL